MSDAPSNEARKELQSWGTDVAETRINAERASAHLQSFGTTMADARDAACTTIRDLAPMPRDIEASWAAHMADALVAATHDTIGPLGALRATITASTGLEPSAWTLPPDLLPGATMLLGLPIVRVGGPPGLVYRP